ncbi:hypothetical protein IMZ48_13710 [Candidatus Bathyarchaeota archaeon]|nr:hypothetical protein [Candidatus Bathyarchaeota archaeon]
MSQAYHPATTTLPYAPTDSTRSNDGKRPRGSPHLYRVRPRKRERMATVGTLQRMEAKTLAEIILAEEGSTEKSYAIIDVRDDGESSLCRCLGFRIPTRNLPAAIRYLLPTSPCHFILSPSTTTNTPKTT